MKAKDFRVIDTGLTGELAGEILDSISGQMSDGIWENSSRMDSYWRFFEIENVNNNIMINVSTEPAEFIDSMDWRVRCKTIYNKFKDMTDFQVKDFLARKLKEIVKIEMEDNKNIGPWKRDNMRELDYIGHHYKVTVADVYKVYDKLKGRVRKAE